MAQGADQSAASDPVGELLALLDIERIELNVFRGIGRGGETSARIFGGHVVAQALVAAYRTVEDRLCHSLHAYFIHPGDPSIPIVFEVDRARDGGSFTTRRVIAIQNGRQIFNMAASFHREEEGWRHQHDAPSTPSPETLVSRDDRRRAVVDRVPEEGRDHFLRARPVEVRDVEPLDLFAPEPASDANQLWFRLARRIDDDAPWLHQCLLAYASDMALLSSGARRHGVSFMSGEALPASLDHAIWFHAPSRFDDWHLYAMDSPFAGGARSFNRGAIFAQGGALVASVAQEGLMRPNKRR